MCRKKVKLTYITIDPARKAIFKKRSETTALRDVEACAAICSQCDSLPDVFPFPLGFKRVDQSRKMVNQESILRQRIAKANEQLRKIRKDNSEVTKAMFQCLNGMSLQGLTMIDLNDIGLLIDQKLKDIRCKIKSLKEEAAAQLRSKAAPTPSVVPAAPDQNMTNNEHASCNGEAGLRARQHGEPAMNTPQEHMRFGAAGDEILPFGDQNHHATWASSPLFLGLFSVFI